MNKNISKCFGPFPHTHTTTKRRAMRAMLLAILKDRKQRDPEVVFWPSGFLEAWATEAKKDTFSQKHWFVGLGAKANKSVCF